MYLRKILSVSLIFSLISCSTLHPKVVVQSFGEMNLSKDTEIQDRANQLEETPSEVKVYNGIMPEGLELAEQGHKLVVVAGYENKYQVLGSVSSGFNKDAYAGFKSTYWTPSFHGKDTWRKGLCYPQAPLKLLTLGIWNLVPLAWPCMSQMPTDETERKSLMINSMAKGAKEFGANILIVTGSESTNITYVRDGRTAGAENISMTGLSGFAVVAK